jgi:hypothetical protein
MIGLVLGLCWSAFFLKAHTFRGGAVGALLELLLCVSFLTRLNSV